MARHSENCTALAAGKSTNSNPHGYEDPQLVPGSYISGLLMGDYLK